MALTRVSGNLIASGVSLTFDAGTAALPALTTSGDTNTGIFFPAADTIAFTEGGAESMRINSSGNVGIGTSSPAFKLDVDSGATATTANFASTTTTAYSPTTSGVVTNSRLTLSGGNATDSYSAIRFKLGGSSENFFGAVQSSAGTGQFVWGGFNGSAYGEWMRLNSAGNVGIGTTTITRLLEVGSGSTTKTAIGQSLICLSANSGNAGYVNEIGFGGSATTNVQSAIGNIVTNDAGFGNGALYFATRSVTATDTAPSERLRITSAGDVGIGTSSPAYKLEVAVGTSGSQSIANFRTASSTATDNAGVLFFGTASATATSRETMVVWDADGANSSGSDNFFIRKYGNSGTVEFFQVSNAPMVFYTNSAERLRIDASGNLLVGRTTTWSGGGDNTVGIATVSSAGQLVVNATGNINAFVVNNVDNDNSIISIRQANTEEGSISISGSTVSYNGGHLSRWAQTTTTKDESIVKGTVLSNLDAMNVYTDAEGNPVDNEQLNKVKVSDTEGDVNVAGVFVNWSHDEAHNVDEINMAMTGDMIIRIAQGVTVVRGDLLMSAGDGTAKPQGDDIIRSKTVAKVTSNHVTCTYADGSYCVPCVLMAC